MAVIPGKPLQVLNQGGKKLWVKVKEWKLWKKFSKNLMFFKTEWQLFKENLRNYSEWQSKWDYVILTEA